MSVGCLPNTIKEEPNAKDREIASMLDRGVPVPDIARHFGDATQTVTNKIRWMQAKRWMTWDMRLLTAWQRDQLIQREKAFIEVEGV
jgi:hypothetical protein